jgi:LacI family transcriptional regulator
LGSGLNRPTVGGVSRAARGVTIKDVAREAGASVASVSRVLNGVGPVSAETRNRVLAAVDKLSYVPNIAARSLITARTDTIGMVLPDLHGEFFSEVIRGADLAASVRGLHLLLASSHADAEGLSYAIRSMRGRVDGLIVMSPHVDGVAAAIALAGDVPTVLLNTELEGRPRPSFRIDNHAGAFAVVRHLAERAQVVAHISGPADNADALARLQGWRDALGDQAGPLLSGDFSEEAGYAAGKALAAMRPRPDAVFAANDIMAVGCLTALAEAGVRVPADMAVAGFDDIPIARLMRPSLTTVSVGIADLSRRALERLARLIDQPTATEDLPEIVRPTVVARESSAATTNVARTALDTEGGRA